MGLRQPQRIRATIHTMGKGLREQMVTVTQGGACSALRAWLVALCQLPWHSRLITLHWRLNKGALKRQPCALGVNRLRILARRLGNHVVQQLLFGVFFLEVPVVLTGFGFEGVGLARLDGQRRLIGRQNNRGILDRPGNRGFSNGTPSRNCSENSELKN